MKKILRALTGLTIYGLFEIYDALDEKQPIKIFISEDSPLHPNSKPVQADYKNSEDACQIIKPFICSQIVNEKLS
jgi:hypothetical protein